jgi:hypothetical protein
MNILTLDISLITVKSAVKVLLVKLTLQFIRAFTWVKNLSVIIYAVKLFQADVLLQVTEMFIQG